MTGEVALAGVGGVRANASSLLGRDPVEAPCTLQCGIVPLRAWPVPHPQDPAAPVAGA